MYKCLSCGGIFEEPKKAVEHYSGANLPDGGYTEAHYDCPYCGSDDYKEVITCAECGEEYFAECKTLYVHFKNNNEYVCDDCLHDYCTDNFS